MTKDNKKEKRERVNELDDIRNALSAVNAWGEKCADEFYFFRIMYELYAPYHRINATKCVLQQY